VVRALLVLPIALLVAGRPSSHASGYAREVGTTGVAAQAPENRRLFPPEDLGILESPDRDEWQQPDRIMDALQIADGSRVADIGAGGGWFTVRLARRVGPNGRVFGQDVQREMVDSIRRRAVDQALMNVETVLGTVDDPKLPPGLDAVLIVDTYPAISDPVRILGFVRASLKPEGLVGIVDFTKDGAGGPGPPLSERLDPEKVRRDAAAAGLTFRAHHTFLRYQYLLVFGK
jgi:ubiquinone/menaquinone biosynthesis C-methylase UbiE